MGHNNKSNINKMADIKERIGGGTPPYERMLEAKRDVLRRALKREYMKQRFDPKHYGGQTGPQVFDTAFMKLNARTTLMYVGIVLAPIYFLTKYTTYRRETFEQACREGKVPIDDNRRRMLWYMC